MKSALVAVVFIASCGGLSFQSGGSNGLELDRDDTIVLERLESASIAAEYTYDGEHVAAFDAEWTSSDPGKVAVSGSGPNITVNALAPGTVTITATGSGFTDSVMVTVNTPHAVSLLVSPAQPMIPAGLTQQMTATATFNDGTTADVTDAATWTSMSDGKATVFQGLVSAHTVGETTITAKFNDQFSSTRIFVIAPLLVSIAVTPNNPVLPKGSPQQFTATGTYSDNSTQNITTSVTWASSTMAVATISNTTPNKGLATTLTAGSTTIAATSGTKTGMTTLMVAPAAISSISISPVNPSTVPLSADFPFTATATFTDNSQTDVTASVTWSSSDSNIGDISNAAGTEGVVDAKAIGGPITISASLTVGATTVNDSTQMTVVLAPVGPFAVEAGYTGGAPCIADAVKFTFNSDAAFVCTAASGLHRGGVSGTTVMWAAANTGITNLNGLSIAVHPSMSTTLNYSAVPSGSAANWFRITSGGTTAATLLDSGATNARFIYAQKFQPGGPGNMLGTWNPTPNAALTFGTNGTTPATTQPAATGYVRSISGTGLTDLWSAVFGETPQGAAATGGIFRCTNATNAVQDWAPRSTGIAASDLPLTTSVFSDPNTAGTVYAGFLGGGRVYKTTDSGATWSPSATGIPTKARVNQVYVAPGVATTVYAATNIGLYRSLDSGATWSLYGFQGRQIRGVAVNLGATIILVATDAGLYRAN